MTTFPILSTGAIAQYPLTRSQEYRTSVQRFVDGSDQRYRELRQPVRRWALRFDQLTSEEAAAIEDFFNSQQGRYGVFSFTDPHDGTEYPECIIESDSIVLDWRSETECQTALIIRSVQA